MRPFPVELPGIEPAAKNDMACGNTEFDDAKRRETTRSDMRIHRKVLMASTKAERFAGGPRTDAVVSVVPPTL
jgi:hypothetical protein